MPTPTRFAQITAGALSVNADVVSIETGKSFVLGQDGTADNHAVTKKQLDVLQTAIDTIAGTNVDYNTLQELKDFIDLSNAQGVTNLTNAVAAETSARIDAVAAETTARINAVSAEESARIDADSAEKAARELADSTEESARINADTALSNVLFKHVLVPLSSAVVPDESSPMPMPYTIKNQSAVDGWYFVNGGSTSPTRKINWYLQAPVDETNEATYASLSEINIPVKLLNKASPPFVTIYTKLKASGNAASWYNARYTFIVNDVSVLTGNVTNFLLRASISGNANVGTYTGFKPIELSKDNYSSLGTILPTDNILAISIGTNSAASAGNVNCIIHSLNVFSSNGNYIYQFSNKDPMQQYLLDKIDQLYYNLGQTIPSLALA